MGKRAKKNFKAGKHHKCTAAKNDERSVLENLYGHYESPGYDSRYVPGAHFDNWMNG